MCDGMFKLKIDINKSVKSTYIVDSFSLWHNRLRHVNHKRMLDMISLNLIPKHQNDMVDKSRICSLTKITRKPFPFKVESATKLLQLIHIDVCDMHSTPTRGGKKYFVTFIDDYSKNC